jgi:GR25 family glycosyltransferase involved in LPS biosynthesis
MNWNNTQNGVVVAKLKTRPTLFNKNNIFVISLNNTIGRSRLLATGKRLAKKGITDFRVLFGIYGNAPPYSEDRDALTSYISSSSGHGLLAKSRCCCWNGVRFADATPDGKGNYVLSAAEGACFVSHMRVWQQLLASADEWAMVFEDDASFTPSFPTASNGSLIFPAFPDDAEMVMFNGDGYSSYKPKTDAAQPLKYSAKGIPSTGFEGYAISRKGARRLLNSANKVVPLTRPLDWLVLQLGLPFAHRVASMKSGGSKTAYENFQVKIYRSIPVGVYTSDSSRTTSEIGKYSGEVKNKVLRSCNKSIDSVVGALS